MKKTIKKALQSYGLIKQNKPKEPLWACLYRTREGVVGNCQNTIEAVIREAEQYGAVAITLLMTAQPEDWK